MLKRSNKFRSYIGANIYSGTMGKNRRRGRVYELIPITLTNVSKLEKRVGVGLAAPLTSVYSFVTVTPPVLPDLLLDGAMPVKIVELFRKMLIWKFTYPVISSVLFVFFFWVVPMLSD